MNKKPKITAFGEIMLRLSPQNDGAIAESKVFDACYGGTEANVLVCMANFGCSTQYLTALPNNQLGNAVLRHLKRFNVGTEYIKLGGEVLGTYFTESGNGSRGASVIYNRSNSEITRITPADFDYDKIFDGADLFHISGISFALSQSCTQTAFALLKEAKKRGVKVSFDFNYRAKLWTTEQAGETFRKVLPYADVVLASPLDLTTFLNVTEQTFFDKYDCELLVLRNRMPIDKNRHKVQVTVYDNRDKTNRRKYAVNETEFDVKEKIGGGDAFDGAMLYKLLTSSDVQSAVEFATKAFICKHKIAGDTFTMSEEEVNAADIKLN